MIPAALDPMAPDFALRLAVVLGLGAVVTVLMEPWALWLHRRIWHGPLWAIHHSHHRPRTGLLEGNDVFALINAPPAIALMAWGTWAGAGLPAAVAYGIGLGVSIYGTAYLLVHDGFIHERLPLGWLERSAWMRAVRTAHRVHHADGDAPFGLFAGPWELARRREQLRAQRKRHGATANHTSTAASS